jgi:hypothetical protein
MTPWTEFYLAIIKSAPLAPEFVIEYAARDAAIEFFRETHVYRRTLNYFITEPLMAGYVVPIPPETRLEATEQVLVNGVEIPKALGSQALNTYVSQPGAPREYYLISDDHMQFNPVPDGVYAVQVLAILKPSRASTGLDETMYEHYADTITHGGLAKLLLEHTAPWANAQLGAWHQQMFDQGIARARGRDHRNVPLRVQYSSF